MGKYVRLTKHLQSLDADPWTASFAELEKILGFPLPASARTYQAWWQPGGLHSHARGWTDAGWKVEKLDLARSWVRFVPSIPRTTKPSTRQGSVPSYRPPAGVGDVRAPTSLAQNSVAKEVSVSVQFGWRPVGQVGVDSGGQLQFPALEDEAGLYCFEFLKDGVTHAYIGETDRLRRRLYHYRMPGPSQQTNLRLNALLKQVLDGGTAVSVSVLQRQPQVRVGEQSRACDLSIKSERVLVEHAAIVALRQSGATALNL